MHPYVWSKWLYLLALIYCATSPVKADTINVRKETMVQMNRYSPVESPYSHGSIGFDLGVGGHMFEMRDPQKLRETYDEFYSSAQTQYMTQLFLIKGLDGPIDLGLVLGQHDMGRVTQYGGHLQWTFVQDIKYPSVAFRGSFSRLQTEVGDMSSSEFMGLVGKGFLSYFTAYAGLGMAHHFGRLNSIRTGDFTIDESNKDTFTVSETEISHIYGLSILCFPPFVSLDFEGQGANKTTARSYTAKVSIGM